MKVGLNATCLSDRPSGAKQRFIGIYGSLIKQMPDVEFVIYNPINCDVSRWFRELPNITARITPVRSEGRVGKLLHGWLFWPRILRDERLDVFERFNLPVVKAPSGKSILTVHDIRGVTLGYSCRRAIFKQYVGRSLRAADRVITVSCAMKEEILNLFPDVPVSVIYNGIDTLQFTQITERDIEDFQSRYSLFKGYALAVGHFEVRKNYLRLIDALALLRDRRVDCPILIIGNDNGQKRIIEKAIAAANLAGRIKLLSGLSDLEVCCAYKLSELFVFPSMYEGFGIPILEAMAANRPMVLSNQQVFREITEDQAIFFPHDDVEAMADAIELGLTSSAERSRIVANYDRRLRDFSFQNLAMQVAAIYRGLTSDRQA